MRGRRFKTAVINPAGEPSLAQALRGRRIPSWRSSESHLRTSDGRGTAGFITFAPEAVHVVTERARLSGEFRSPDDSGLDDAAPQFEASAQSQGEVRMSPVGHRRCPAVKPDGQALQDSGEPQLRRSRYASLASGRGQPPVEGRPPQALTVRAIRPQGSHSRRGPLTSEVQNCVPGRFVGGGSHGSRRLCPTPGSDARSREICLVRVDSWRRRGSNHQGRKGLR
jgi:hypothetical protein